MGVPCEIAALAAPKDLVVTNLIGQECATGSLAQKTTQPRPKPVIAKMRAMWSPVADDDSF